MPKTDHDQPLADRGKTGRITADGSTHHGIAPPGEGAAFLEAGSRRRRRLLALLGVLLLALAGVTTLFIRYINNRTPLPDLIAPQVDLNYPPHYLFSIFGVDNPVGVALSPDGDRIYVTESEGARLVQIFDRSGAPLGSLSPPRTNVGERSPVYLATDSDGWVYVTDRLQHAIFLYDEKGRYQDTILAPDLTLSEYIALHTETPLSAGSFAFSLFQNRVYYESTGNSENVLPSPGIPTWSPLGIRFDPRGKLILTDVAKGHNRVRELTLQSEPASNLQGDFNPIEISYGASGQGNGEFLFPNSAMADSQRRVYVSDGNNGRISVWGEGGEFLFNFGSSSGDGSLSLPRGIFIDSKDRLYVVDAVGQDVKVFDVSGPQPEFLFVFGDFGMGDGLFSYPNDIAVDDTGRLYIADRENDRVQVWSY